MSNMVRKQIYIEPKHEVSLKRMARITGMTEAEIIRRALEFHLKESGLFKKNQDAWKKEVKFIKKLMRKRKKITPKKRTWKREELYD